MLSVHFFITVTQQGGLDTTSSSSYGGGAVGKQSVDTKQQQQHQQQHQQQQKLSPDSKSEDIKQWVESSRPQGGPPYRPCTPPFPPPDIVSSNVVKPPLSPTSSSSRGGARVDGKKVYLGADEDAEVLRLDKDNELLTEEVEELRAKWSKEKEQLEKIKDTLTDMLHLSPDELKEVFKEKKKQKLLLMIR